MSSISFIPHWFSVTYWPSTELSIMRCTCVNNWCIRSKISGYHLDLWTGWIRCNCDAHRKQVDVKQLYYSVPQTVWVSWSQLHLEFELQVETVRTSSRQRACGPQWPPVEQPKKFPDFFVQAFKIVRLLKVDYVITVHLMRWLTNFLWFSRSNEQLQQELEYTLLKPDCHSWWISKMQWGHFRRTICNKILF